MTTTEDHSAYFAEPVVMTSTDGVQMDKDRYVLPLNDGTDGKWHPHTRVTTVSNRLPSSYGLGIWAQDRVAWAMAQRPDLCALLASVPIDDVATIREVRAKAEIVAAMDEGANLGTATHNILQRVDRGEPIETLARIFHPDVKAYQAKLAEYGLTVLPEYIERVVRLRVYGIAGRFDNIMAEADGTLVVADKKTKGKPTSVHDVATQLAIYANADEMFDPITGRYLPMPPVRKDYALMIHIEPGSGVCTITKIDIRRGAWSIEISQNVDAWQKMTHLGTPYIMPSPTKPVDYSHPKSAKALVSTDPALVASVPTAKAVGTEAAVAAAMTTQALASAPAASNGHGTPDLAFVAEVAATTLAESYARHGAPAAVAAPDPTSYGAPADVPAPAAYVPVALPPRAEAVLMTNPDGTDDADTEADEILIVFKSKSKAVMQDYARRYGITDLAHHKAHIAKSIALARADRRKAGLDAEPSGSADTSPTSVASQPASETGQTGEPKRHPQTMAEAGFTGPVPASPPGKAVVGPDGQQLPAAERPQTDLAEQQVLADIACAMTVQRIGDIWAAWTNSGRAWAGNVQAAADARVAAIQSAVGQQAGAASNEPPF